MSGVLRARQPPREVCGLKSWKQAERRVAALLEGERVPVTGCGPGAAPNVNHARLSIEVESRKRLPDRIRGAMRRAEASAGEGQTPLAVPVEHGDPYADALAVMRLEELAGLLQERDAAA